jgi:hypothetical protein
MRCAILRLACLSLACSLIAWAAPCQAQFGTNTSGGSTGGSSYGMGATGSGANGAAGSLGSSGARSTSSGMFGSRNMGGGTQAGQRSLTGGGGGSAQSLDQMNANAGQITGNERFMRGNRQGQFVGSDTTDLRNLFSQMGQTNGRQGMQGLNNMNQNGPNQPDGGGNQRQRIAYTLQRRIAFDVPARAPAALSATLTQRITAIAPNLPIDVQMVGRIAVLRGTVGSQHARDLAAQVVLLEPGVSSVQNELEVAESQPLPEQQ